MRLYLKLLAFAFLAVMIHRLIPPAIGPLDEAQFTARAFGADYLRTENHEQIVAAAVRLLARERARFVAARPDLFPNGPGKLESPPQDDDVAAVNAQRYSPCDSSTQEPPSHGLRRDCPSSQAVRATDGELPPRARRH